MILRFFSDFKTYADIRIDERGSRRLLYGGYRFGQVYEYKGVGDIRWKCTSNYIDSNSGQRRGCRAFVRTKMIDGYEMIQNIRVKHDHP